MKIFNYLNRFFGALLNFLLEIFKKQRKVNLIVISYMVAEGLAIILFSIFIGIFFFRIGHSLIFYYEDHEPHNFLKNILSSIEVLFIAPIPLLIIFSFKRIIFKIFPNYITITKEEMLHLMDEIVAKKAFISSIIGVISTFLLGSFVEIFTTKKIDDKSIMNVYTHPVRFVTIIVLLMAFLGVLIMYYTSLSKHHPEEK